MLIWQVHIALALGLIALVLAAALILWTMLYADHGSGFFKIIGYFIAAIALINLLGMGYSLIREAHRGWFKQPCPMMRGMDQTMGRKEQKMLKPDMNSTPQPSSPSQPLISSSAPSNNCSGDRCQVNPGPMLHAPAQQQSLQALIKA